ncbi:hypothetical protein M1O54_06680, partial [Dehalococcoidia bacterium]|nr:hypothetical protein [Dehalococcoidia bacterium]
VEGQVFVDNPHITIVYNEPVTITAATIGDLDVIDDLLTIDDRIFGLPTKDLAEGDHTFSITAADAAGNEVTGTLTFTVCLTAEIPLHEGWNLISLPLMIDPTPPADLLAGILDHVKSVWHFDAADGAWKAFSPRVGGDLAYMDDGMAFWIEMSAPATLTVTGPEIIREAGPVPPPTIPVVEGWNMVGFTSRTPMPSAEYFAGLDLRVVWGFELGRWVEDPENLQPGRGYWIKVVTDGAIILEEDHLIW